MKLQELLTTKGINLEQTKLIRHNITNEVVAANYAHDYLELYQSIQSPARFKNCDTVIAFLGTEGTNGVFLGCYKIGGSVPYNREVLPGDFIPDSGMDSNCVIFELEKTDVLAEFANRLVIDWGKGTINWCQKGTTEKEILEIRPAVSEIEFTGYDRVLLSYDTLRKIVYNKAVYKEWEDKLSAVAGVYLITDTKTGKQYVGSTKRTLHEHLLFQRRRSCNVTTKNESQGFNALALVLLFFYINLRIVEFLCWGYFILLCR